MEIAPAVGHTYYLKIWTPLGARKFSVTVMGITDRGGVRYSSPEMQALTGNGNGSVPLEFWHANTEPMS